MIGTNIFSAFILFFKLIIDILKEVNDMLCVLIMAGGVGSRFWPKSTEEKPKQFLKLVSNEKTMLQLTYERMNKLVPRDNIFIVTNERYIDLVKENIPGINSLNIITEPCSKNTEPCILLSALYLKKLKGDISNICVSFLYRSATLPSPSILQNSKLSGMRRIFSCKGQLRTLFPPKYITKSGIRLSLK